MHVHILIDVVSLKLTIALNVRHTKKSTSCKEEWHGSSAKKVEDE